MGETAHIECFVDNRRCSSTIRSLNIEFRRIITGKAKEVSYYAN
jgi:hypothetical protein